MESVYYPFFWVEKSIRKQFKHQRNIILLSLFCNDILIPVRHILSVSADEFDILMRFDELFKDGTLYYRLPDNIDDIEQYFKNTPIPILGIPPKTVESRINTLKKFTLRSPQKKYDPMAQQRYYSERMASFLRLFVERHSRIKRETREALSKITETGLLTKENFDVEIKKLYDNDALSKDVFNKLKNASNVLYCLAGSSGKAIKVCNDELFDEDHVDACMLETIQNYKEIVNESYNPNRMVKALQEAGIIRTEEELKRLKCSDVVELRSTKWHKKFIEKYCNLADTNRALNYVTSKKNLLTRDRRKICVIDRL